MLAHTYACAGRTTEARRLLAELKALSEDRYVTSYGIALIHVALEEPEDGLSWLKMAFEEKSWRLIYLKVDPRLDSLRSDPRFQDLVDRMNFPDGV